MSAGAALRYSRPSSVAAAGYPWRRRSASLRANKSLEPNGTLACIVTCRWPKPCHRLSAALGGAMHARPCRIHPEVIHQERLLSGERVLMAQATEFMGPVLCDVFAEQGADVVANSMTLLRFVLPSGLFVTPDASMSWSLIWPSKPHRRRRSKSLRPMEGEFSPCLWTHFHGWSAPLLRT